MSDEYLAAGAGGAQEEEYSRWRHEKQGEHTRINEDFPNYRGHGAVPAAGHGADDGEECCGEEHADRADEEMEQGIGSDAGGAAACQCPHRHPHPRRRDGRCAGSHPGDLLFERHGGHFGCGVEWSGDSV